MNKQEKNIIELKLEGQQRSKDGNGVCKESQQKNNVFGGITMIKIARKMESSIIKSGDYGCSQASINSDGVITLRNYNPFDKNVDEIIVLSKEETNAIMELFRILAKLKEK